MASTGGFSAQHAQHASAGFTKQDEKKKVPGGQKYVDPRRQKKSKTMQPMVDIEEDREHTGQSLEGGPEIKTLNAAMKEAVVSAKGFNEDRRKGLTVVGPGDAVYSCVMPDEALDKGIEFPEYYKSLNHSDFTDIEFRILFPKGGGRKFKLNVGELKKLVKQRNLSPHLEATVYVGALNGVPAMKKAFTRWPDLEKRRAAFYDMGGETEEESDNSQARKPLDPMEVNMNFYNPTGESSRNTEAFDVSLATTWSASAEFALAILTLLCSIACFALWHMWDGGYKVNGREFFNSDEESFSYLPINGTIFLLFSLYRFLVVFVFTREDPYAVSNELHRGGWKLQCWVRMSICSRHMFDVLAASFLSIFFLAIMFIAFWYYETQPNGAFIIIFFIAPCCSLSILWRLSVALCSKAAKNKEHESELHSPRNRKSNLSESSEAAKIEEMEGGKSMTEEQAPAPMSSERALKSYQLSGTARRKCTALSIVAGILTALGTLGVAMLNVNGFVLINLNLLQIYTCGAALLMLILLSGAFAYPGSPLSGFCPCRRKGEDILTWKEMLYDKTPTDRVLHIHLHRGKYMQDASPEAKRIMVEKAYKLAIGKTSWGFSYCQDYWYHLKNTHPLLSMCIGDKSNPISPVRRALIEFSAFALGAWMTVLFRVYKEVDAEDFGAQAIVLFCALPAYISSVMLRYISVADVFVIATKPRHSKFMMALGSYLISAVVAIAIGSLWFLRYLYPAQDSGWDDDMPKDMSGFMDNFPNDANSSGEAKDHMVCGRNCKKSLEAALLSQGVIYILAFLVDMLSFPVRHCVEKSVESSSNNVVKRVLKKDQTSRRSIQLDYSHTSTRTMSAEENMHNPMGSQNPMQTD